MKKCLLLVIVFFYELEILILDEFIVGIDLFFRKMIWEKFYDFKKKGIMIIVMTYIMDEVEFCECLGLIREGKLVVVGIIEELKKCVLFGWIEDVFLLEEVVLL